MKTIVAVLAAFTLSACAGSSDRADNQSSSMRESSELAGSATQAPMVKRGNTMNDHDKLLEMCESLNTGGDCEKKAMQCRSEADAESCLKNQ